MMKSKKAERSFAQIPALINNLTARYAAVPATKSLGLISTGRCGPHPQAA
jgi:hypothetical protein